MNEKRPNRINVVLLTIEMNRIPEQKMSTKILFIFVFQMFGFVYSTVLRHVYDLILIFKSEMCSICFYYSLKAIDEKTITSHLRTWSCSITDDRSFTLCHKTIHKHTHKHYVRIEIVNQNKLLMTIKQMSTISLYRNTINCVLNQWIRCQGQNMQ